jgi:hypothetical protein
MKLTDRVRRLLQASGWDDERSVDIQPVEDLLAGEIEVHPLAQEVLRSLHGISCSTDRSTFFDVPMAVTWLSPKDTPWLHGLINKPLCPIGCGERMILLLAPDGEVVWLHDEWLVMYRFADLAQALDAIIFFDSTRQQPIPIPEDKLPPRYRSS